MIEVALAVGLGSGSASAADPAAPRVIVQSDRCVGLVSAEVGRLLDIELSTVITEIRSGPPLEVVLRCDPTRMTIEVVDPLTRKRLARDIPVPAPEPGRERVVALAISQLFAASWLELLTTTETPPPPADEQADPPDEQAVEAARRVAERSTGSNAEPDRRRTQRDLELLLGGGPRGRALESQGPLAGVHFEALLRGWLTPAIGLVGLVGTDFAQSTRRLGQVRGVSLTAGGGLAWGVRPGPIGVGGHFVVSGGWARVRGIPRESGVPAGTNAGFTGEVSLGVGPRVRYGRLRFDIDAEAGSMLRPPVGLVEGGPPMTMGGLWVGLVLRLGSSLLR